MKSLESWNYFVFTVGAMIFFQILLRIAPALKSVQLSPIKLPKTDRYSRKTDQYFTFYYTKFLPVLEVVMIAGSWAVTMLQVLATAKELNDTLVFNCTVITVGCALAVLLCSYQRHLIKAIIEFLDKRNINLITLFIIVPVAVLIYFILFKFLF